MSGVIQGEGYTVAPSLDALGEGYGFRKIRSALGITEFGANAVVIPPGYTTHKHFHDTQQELYILFSGRLAIQFGDGTQHELAPGGLARVDAATVRGVSNLSADEDAIYICVGAANGYVGRDAHTAES